MSRLTDKLNYILNVKDDIKTALESRGIDMTDVAFNEYGDKIALIGDLAPDAWTPAEIPSGLSMWLDADDSTTITIVDGKVSQWSDKSGTGIHVSQSTPESRPTYVNGEVVFRTSTLTNTARNETLTAESLFIVFRANAAVNAERIFTQKNNSGNDYQITGHYIPLLRNQTAYEFCSFATNAFRAAITTSEGKNIFSSIHTGSLITNILNGNRSATYSHTLNLAITSINIGDNFDGEVCEILLFFSAVDATLRQKIEGYLAHKWDLLDHLPSDHPYKTDYPVTEV